MGRVRYLGATAVALIAPEVMSLKGDWQKFKAGKTAILPPASAATAVFYSVETIVLPLVSLLPMTVAILMNIQGVPHLNKNH